MQVYFWGTRGSLPASITAKMIEAKIFKALQRAQSLHLDSDDAVNKFIRNELPFSVRGSYGGNTSCVEVRSSDEYVICDAGTGLRDFGNHILKTKKTSGPGSIFHIFLSHLHWDHIQGFPFFAPAFIPGNQVNIYACHTALEQVLVHQQNSPCFPVPLRAMNADIRFHVLETGRPYDIAGMEITVAQQNHPDDSYGYCFRQGGKKLVYSTDCEHKEDSQDDHYNFIGFFRNADLLIFDAQYKFSDAVGTKENWGHSSNLVGVELALRSGVRRLCLFHNEHTCDDETLDQFLNDTRQYLRLIDDASDLGIDLAYDGLEITL